MYEMLWWAVGGVSAVIAGVVWWWESRRDGDNKSIRLWTRASESYKKMTKKVEG